MKNCKGILIFILILMLLLASCSSKDLAGPSPKQEDGRTESSMSADDDKPVGETEPKVDTTEMLKPFDDIRYFEGYSREVYEESEYNREDVYQFIFNQGTVLRGSEELQAQVMENGKNPGLGIRAIHEQGITGKGVYVAVIDQPLLPDHPEIAGKIAAYYDTGCGQDEDTGSMHGPAVTSLLAGNDVGVAPDAKVYYAAAPSWAGDGEYFAKGLYWIIEENKKLPDDEKIRVVSVSAAPSGEGHYGTAFTKNLSAWGEAVHAAKEDGILVLDCTGFVAPAFYNPSDPDNVSACTGGYPKKNFQIPSSQIGVPASYRTAAVEYFAGSPSFEYYGEGGLSWGIPYAAGVLALGWQINPSLDQDQIVQILFDTCSIAGDGSNIVNPPAFIEAVQNTLK